MDTYWDDGVLTVHAERYGPAATEEVIEALILLIHRPQEFVNAVNKFILQ
jgi:hypothetical protein